MTIKLLLKLLQTDKTRITLLVMPVAWILPFNWPQDQLFFQVWICHLEFAQKIRFSLITVKLTDPVTAILYITSDYQHMQELKHTIHVKEVIDGNVIQKVIFQLVTNTLLFIFLAPAHEHHVIALHKHGNKLGGLPAIFWFSIGFLILVFHLFLFKLIWQEYCAGSDRYRAR